MSGEEEYLYMVLVMKTELDLQTETGGTVAATLTFDGTDGFVGVIPVFNSREAAEKVYPGREILTLGEVKKDE